jgi:hypothetical protein
VAAPCVELKDRRENHRLSRGKNQLQSLDVQQGAATECRPYNYLSEMTTC